MSVKELKVNIGNQLVDFRDLNAILEVLTKKDQEKIQQLTDDITTIDQQAISNKKFEDLGKKLKEFSTKLTTSTLYNKDNIFAERVPLPIGMQASEFITFLDVTVEPNAQLNSSTISVQPTQLAVAEQWQSKSFNSKLGSVVQNSSGTNSNLFKPGTIKILTQNNGKIFTHDFNSKATPIVGSGLMQVGKFFISGSAVNVSASTTLNDIIKTINALNVGVKASIEQHEITGKYKLALRSEKMGSDNSFTIDDPNGVFSQLTKNSAGEYCDVIEDYKQITLAAGDSLERIASKFNAVEKDTLLRAIVLETTPGQYTLNIQSTLPGIQNKFKIVDGVTLNGANTGVVLNDVFNFATCIKKAANNAKILMNDIEIENVTNTFKLYDGVKVNVKSTSTKPISFEITSDINRVFVAISDLVDKYNLFRQTYETSYKLKTNRSDIALQKDHTIKGVFERLDNVLQSIEDLNVGISKGELTVDVIEDDKAVKKEFKNMILIDKIKLFDCLSTKYDEVMRAFDLSFISTSSDFIQPIISKPIAVNNQPLGSNKIDLNIEINSDLITVKSKSSISFSDVNDVVNVSDSKKFQPGIFWVNGFKVTITSGMSLHQIASAINSVSHMSRVSAAIFTDASGDSYISFTQYSGNFAAADDAIKFERLNIYDPSGVLQNVFSVALKTTDFDINNLTSPSSDIVIGNQLLINGVSIIPTTNTLGDLLTQINDVTNQTGITATAILNHSTNKYFIQFDTNKAQDIDINNSGGALNVLVSTPLSQQSHNKFFDTSNALKTSFKMNEISYNKRFVYTIFDSSIQSGGIISILNDQQIPKIDNLEILFTGGTSAVTQLTISQGFASNLANELDKILSLNVISGSSTNAVTSAQSSLEGIKLDINRNLETQKHRLESKKKSITLRHTRAMTTIDKMEAFKDFGKFISGIKSDD